MRRVLQCHYGMNCGGIETMIMNIYRNIDKEKLQFDFLLNSRDNFYESEILSLGGKIYYLPSRKDNILNYRRNFDVFFDNYHEYEIIHQHVGSLANITALEAAKHNDIPVRIIHGHSTSVNSLPHKLLNQINRTRLRGIANYYFACSGDAGKYIYNRKIRQSNNYRIIKNGIDTALFGYNPDIRNEMKKKYRLENKFVIGIVGQMREEKNHAFFLHVFKNFLKRNKNGFLFFIGDGPCCEKLKLLSVELGITKSIYFAGIKKNVYKYLNLFDVFVLPSKYEGLSMALIEAQTNGLYCIASDQVPREANVTNHVKFLSLSNESNIWEQELNLAMGFSERQNAIELVKNAGYDILNTSKKMEEFYLTCI